jgi:hypothetical protein
MAHLHSKGPSVEADYWSDGEVIARLLQNLQVN